MFKQIRNKISKIFIKEEESMAQPELDKLETKLLGFLQQDDASVTALNGEWGVGKTHFWNDFAKAHLSDKTVVYVSLFGKESIKDIHTSIMLQVSKHFEKAGEVRETFGSTKILGIELASMFSIGMAKDFENIIVCFDDFERLSGKLDDKDILGLIAELREQKECKVVMIYNQDQVTSETLSTYKDKVIDYELHFRPSPSQSYAHIEKKLNVFNQYPLKYFKRKGITNIRIMKRAINALNDFAFIKPYVDGFEQIEKEIINKVLQFSVVNGKYHTFNFEQLIEYTKRKRRNKYTMPPGVDSNSDSDFKIDNDYEDMLYLLDRKHSLSLINENVTKNINSYIQNSIPNEKHLIQVIEELKEKSNRYTIKDAVDNLYLKLNYDLNYNNESFIQDMSNLIKVNKEDIVEILSPNSFISCIDELCNIDKIHEQDYHDIGVECLRLFLPLDEKIEKLTGLLKNNQLDNIMKFDNSLEEHINEIQALSHVAQISTKQNIIELLVKTKEQGSDNNKVEVLALINDKVYKQYIKEDASFLEVVVDFIQWTQSFSDNSAFQEVVNKFIAGFEEIQSEGNETVQFKISNILKDIKNDTQENEEQENEEQENAGEVRVNG